MVGTLTKDKASQAEEAGWGRGRPFDPDHQRGRKRFKSPLPLIIMATQTPSGESATLRGRRRHRSTSLITLSALPSRAPSRTLRDMSQSPSSKRSLRFTRLDRCRSQSPSRSRSPDAFEASKRRRHRTRSRSRDHQARTVVGVMDVKSSLRTMVTLGEATEPAPGGEHGLAGGAMLAQSQGGYTRTGG